MIKNSMYVIFTILAFLFISVTWAIFYYFDIEPSNKWSTFFSFVSALSIFATFLVYFFQVQMKNSDEKEEIKSYKRIYHYEFHDYTSEIVNDISELIHDVHNEYGIIINNENIDMFVQAEELERQNIEIKITLPSVKNYSSNLKLNRIAILDEELFNIITTESACIDSIIKKLSKLNLVLIDTGKRKHKNTEICLILRELYEANVYLNELIMNHPYRKI
ncbi:hypothetical protein ABN057_20225 [Providencia alcalifaciens]|uniref:hypothetical protein n=1 Tax=Providencia TaxID=586 RepID=UPI0023494CBE|nr:hypothetical protein [Providencia sp. PROV110]